ncbi:MAG: ABC transporter permease [Acidimicrobiia bacterium]|nr:ABC transporter permease [Acidimicrobiia bacterium]
MNLLSDVLDFFLTVESWIGEDGLLVRTADHLGLSLFAALVAVLLALPPAVWLGHRRRGAFLAVALVNIGRAVPSFGIVALAFPLSLRLGLGLGFWPTFVALVALALPPVFTNTYTGIREVDPATVEAARGMGMTDLQLLVNTELPLAMPVIWTAIRVATVQVIATATLGAVIGWGGLGRYLIDGFAQGNDVWVLAGGIMVAGLAILADLAFTVAERWVLPHGLAARGRAQLDAIAV